MNEQGTWIELVREHWPGISDKDGEDVLFNATCFPFGSAEQVVANLKEMYVRSGGCPNKAMNLAIEDLDAAMAELRMREDD